MGNQQISIVLRNFVLEFLRLRKDDCGLGLSARQLAYLCKCDIDDIAPVINDLMMSRAVVACRVDGATSRASHGYVYHIPTKHKPRKKEEA